MSKETYNGVKKDLLYGVKRDLLYGVKRELLYGVLLQKCVQLTCTDIYLIRNTLETH